MKKTLVAILILTASVAGVCFAGDNTVGNEANPPSGENSGPNANAMDNGTYNSDSNTTMNNT